MPGLGLLAIFVVENPLSRVTITRMSALPPGYTRCPNDAGHIYPSYLPECNVCAELRARGATVPTAMVNMNTVEPAVEENPWPKIAVFGVVGVVVALGIWGVMRQTGDAAPAVASNQTAPAGRPAQAPTNPVRPVMPTPSPARVPSAPASSGSSLIEGGSLGGRPLPVVTDPRPLPLPPAERGVFKSQDGDLAGHWEIQQGAGSTVMNLDIAPVGDRYSAYVQGGVHTPRPNNVHIMEYDGTKLLIQENWAMLGGTDYRFQRVGPQLFEGSAVFNGRQLYTVKMVKAFE